MAELQQFPFGEQLSAQPVIDYSTQQQAATERRNQLLTGDVQRPSVWDIFGPGLSDPQGARGAYRRIMAERAKPVIAELTRTGTQALAAGDDATLDQVISGFNNLAGNFPEYGKFADRFIDQVNTQRFKREGNKALLEAFGQIYSKDPDAQRAIGALSQQLTRLTPEQTQKVLEQMKPNVQSNEQWVDVTSALGTPLRRTLKPSIAKVGELTGEEREALALRQAQLGLTPNQFVDLRNEVQQAISEDKPIAPSKLRQLQQANQLLYGGQGEIGAVGEAIDVKRLNVPAAIGLGIEPEMSPELTRTAPRDKKPQTFNEPVQRQVLADSEEFSKFFKFTPQETRIWQGMLAQESSLGQRNVGDGGKSLGPGQVQKAALADVNKRYNVDIKHEELATNPRLATWASAAYYRIKLDEAQGDPLKAAKAYNGGGDPQYVQKVERRIQQLQSGPGVNYQRQEGETPTQFAQRIAIEKQAQTQYLQTQATQRAMGEEQPATEDLHALKLDSQGNITEYQGPRPTVDQLSREGWFTTKDQAIYKRMLDYQRVKEQGLAVYQDVVNASEKDFDYVNRLIANGASLPIKVPGVGFPLAVTVPGVGLRGLTENQGALFTKLASFAQASEQFLNSSGKGNQYIESVKSGLTGAAASRTTALLMLKNTLESAQTQITGEFKTRPGAIDPRFKGLELQLPPDMRLGDAGGKTLIAKALDNFIRVVKADKDTVAAKLRLLDVGVNDKVKAALGQWADSIIEQLGGKRVAKPLNDETRSRLRGLSRD